MAGISVPGNSCGPCVGMANVTCLFNLSDLCVYYSGSNLTGPNINTGDNLDVVITKLVQFIGSTTTTTSTTTTSTSSTTSTTTSSTTTSSTSTTTTSTSTSTTTTTTTSTTSTTTSSTTTTTTTSTPTVQFMWVVGGPANFSTPTPPVAGATTFVTSLIAGFNVRVSRGGLWQLGLNPGTGNSYYIKTSQGSNTITFTPALSNQEEMIIETIPI